MFPPDTAVADVPVITTGLRNVFGSGETKSESWRRTQLLGFQRMLTAHRSDFESALATDLGKSVAEANLTEIGFLQTEVAHTLRHLSRWMSPKRVTPPPALFPASARVVREPLGVVLIIAPWNYPLMLALSPLLGAIAAGNTAVVKPSELAPATSATIARLLPQYLDPHAIAVVTGGVPQTTALLAEKFDHIFYTGSGRVGKIVATAAAQHLTPITLELGGKSPTYIDGSVPLPEVAKRLAWAKFLNAGQTCVAPDYVLAQSEVLARLTPLLTDAIHELYGSAIDRNPDYGRIINDAQFERLVSYLSDGTIVSGGTFDAASRYIAPTVLTGVSRDSALMRDEIFGPILPLIPVTDLDDAIRWVKAGDKPLAAYIFSDDPAVRLRWETETSSGALTYNAPVLHLSVPALPFGGVGASGSGSYHGERSFTTFSHEKAVLSKPLHPDTLGPTIMPPFGAMKVKLIRKLLQKLQ